MKQFWKIWMGAEDSILLDQGTACLRDDTDVFIGEFEAVDREAAERVYQDWYKAQQPTVWPLGSRALVGDICNGHCGACLDPIDQSVFYWAWPPEGDRVAACSTECRVKVQTGG